ncbi:expressed unknown protein [Seminavis robusta]|uniref:Uncharacterized protein n=1 Tax=Seminavis robusta TaxID=568900 RepID=A0A9N8HEF1_9STRA|nr:expressed unknown protein [Seminavis robusta]|eukprot:Sro301_g111880.1 n/a (181) ;mRNA; f:23943-24598
MATFPPPSIAVDGIVDNCEQAEMMPNCDPAVPIVEMAALLYHGDTIQARHLYRRYREGCPAEVQAALEAWWGLGRAMMEYDLAQIWPRLTQLQQQQPKPYCNYAQEIGTALCRRLLPKLASIWNKSNASVLLGLPRQEWNVFLESQRKALIEDAKNKTPKLGSEHTTDIIAFLESPTLRI